MVNPQLLEDKHTSGVYYKRDITIVRGAGALVWDQHGQEYIDCVAGQGVSNVGHCHPTVVDAIQKQAKNLVTCPEIFYNDQRAKLLEQLSTLGPGEMKRAFLCNSGAEAIEAAIKFARISTKRTEIISALRSFHGRTMGALTLTGQKKLRAPFAPLLPGVIQIPYNNIEALRNSVTQDTAAVILEIIQGEGGVRPANIDFLQAAQALCNEIGAMFIVDEVQTGLGRTGKMLACNHYNIEPDILCLAKSLGGGIPMGATLLGSRVKNLQAGTHGSTFGGNPLACAASLAVLKVLERENLPERAARHGARIMKLIGQSDLPNVREIRGLGLMIGIELKHKVTPVLKELQQSGILALPAGNTVLRLLPPLTIKQHHVDRVIHTVIEVLSNIAKPT
jgi:acetylornithine/LysW-gamma-L-lysine aminotransferase